jgi:hypothetical protein
MKLLFNANLRLGDDIQCAVVSKKLRAEIERMRSQVHRRRGEIRQRQRAGISTTSAEALLARMLFNIDNMCAERDRLKKEPGGPVTGKVLGGRSW